MAVWDRACPQYTRGAQCRLWLRAGLGGGLGGVHRGLSCLVVKQFVGAGEAEAQGPAMCCTLATGLGQGRDVSALRGIADGLFCTSTQASTQACHHPAA